MRRVAAAGWAAIALAASCEQPRTELVVRVDSEVTWGPGQRVQSVVLSVRRGGATGPLRDRRTTALGPEAGRTALPLYVGVLAGDDMDTPVWIEALGCGGPSECDTTTAVVAQRAVVRFARGQTLEVPLLLASACSGVTCRSDQRCEPSSGICAAAVEAQVLLRTYLGPQPSVSRDAAADRSFGMDAVPPIDTGPTTDTPVDVRLPIDAQDDVRGPADASEDVRALADATEDVRALTDDGNAGAELDASDSGTLSDAGADVGPADGGSAACGPWVAGLDLRTVHLRGVATVNGAAAGNDLGFTLRGAAGDTVAFTAPFTGAGSTGAYDVMVLPDTYDLAYTRILRAGSTTTVPQNTDAVVARGITIGADTTRAIDLRAFRLRGAATVNGAAVAGFDLGFMLRGAAGDTVAFTAPFTGAGSTGAYDVMVLPGTYDLAYTRVVRAGSSVAIPQNTDVVVARGLTISADTARPIDLRTVRLRGAATVNGAAVAGFDLGFTLRGAAGDTVAFAAPFTGTTSTGAYDVMVLPGTYDLAYTRILRAGSGVAVPQNANASLGCYLTP